MTIKVRKTVFITHEFWGTHMWDNAKASPSFLQETHAHKFLLALEVTVTDSNRETEFFQLRELLVRTLNKVYSKNKEGFYSLGERSCEMIAEDLANHLINFHKINLKKLSVSEDGYQGASVEVV